MIALRKIALQIPEYLLIIGVVFYWISAGILLNPIAIVLFIGLIFQIVFKNKTIGIIIPSILTILSIYMIFALISEVNKFQTYNSEANKLLFVGLSLFISVMLTSGIMFYKYSYNMKSLNP